MQPVANLIEGNVAGFSFKDPDELAPPILRLDACDVGYDGTPVLRNLELRVDADDRIALLGANGQGKSTLSKLIAGRLDPLTGKKIASSKLRIGYFAQHQLDELTLGDTPAKLRSRLAQGGIGEAIADNPVEKLSGGQKARLAILIATIDAPHLVILDEPTNHLDIESREALIHALTTYGGAVILVSHDPHLVDCVADRLWLVDEGKQSPGKLRDDLAKAEARVEKLQEMLERLDNLMADPKIFGDPKKTAELAQKRVEIVEAVDRAETLWLRAQEAVDQVEKR